MFQPTRALLADVVGFLTVTQAGAGQPLLFGAKIGLAKAPIAPTVNTILSDVTKANYTGYAEQAAAPYSTAYIGQGVKSLVVSATTTWRPGDAVTPNTIYAAYVVDTTSAILLGVEPFDTPIPLPDASHQFEYAFVWGQDPAANFGNGTIVL